MSSVKIDCRAMFRLHALDLWNAPQPLGDTHWMLRRDHELRGWLADVAREFGRLRRAGGGAFDGRPITGLAVIRQLGLESCGEPEGFWGHLKFAARMLVATTCESFRVQREIMRLESSSRYHP